MICHYALVKRMDGEKLYLSIQSEFLPKIVVNFGDIYGSYIFAEREDVERFKRGEDGEVRDENGELVELENLEVEVLRCLVIRNRKKEV